MSDANSDQFDSWNGPAGQGWVQARRLLDEMLQPFEDQLVRLVAEQQPAAVLDVGCGTGSTTRAMARVLKPGATCVGTDLSQPMLREARRMAEQESSEAKFVHADAQTHDFGQDVFDLIVSRFGVMFFADPIAAMSNLHKSAANGGRLHCIVWRSPQDNQFMTDAIDLIKPYIEEMPPPEPNAPGQFGFADPEFVESVLSASGWQNVAIEPLDVQCSFDRADLNNYAFWVGPLGRFLQEAEEDLRIKVLEEVPAAFAPYIEGNRVNFNAACWQVEAGK